MFTDSAVKGRETLAPFNYIPTKLKSKQIRRLDTLHAERQIDQIRRRAIQDETIPHAEKIFSLFQPHTEWISKGKADDCGCLPGRIGPVEMAFAGIMTRGLEFCKQVS